MYRLHIIPLSLKKFPHELFLLQAPNISSENLNAHELNDILLDIKVPLAATNDIFSIRFRNDPFWSEDKKQFIRIIYKVSDLVSSAAEIVELLQKNFCIDLFIDQPIQLETFNFLKQVQIHPTNLRFICIENRSSQESKESIFNCIPSFFKSRVYFLFLPSSLKNEFNLTPTQVLSRIEERRSQCLQVKQSLKIISIINLQVFLDHPEKKLFYLNPTKENYYKYTHLLRTSVGPSDADSLSNTDFYLLGTELWIQKINKSLLNVFLFFVWKIRHIYWDAEHFITYGPQKILSYITQTYWVVFALVGKVYVKVIKLFWYFYSAVARSGIAVKNIPGRLYKYSVELYWRFRKSQSVLINIFIQLYWKTKKKRNDFYLSVVQSAWKIKSFLVNMYIRVHWICRAMASASLNFFVQLYWKLNKVIRYVVNLFIQGYWKSRDSILYPFFKLYWFAVFQFKKRVLALFAKNKENIKNAAEKIKK